jgi:hypothetical protein
MIVNHASERFQQAEILRMFPTFLWKATVAPAVAAPMNAALVDALGAVGAPLSGLSHGQSWQSPYDLHQRAPFRNLVACVGLGRLADAAASREPATTRNPAPTFWNEAGL